ncbi:triose-phosphate isomerase [Halobacterium salinarum]|uniref:Triosephosphate isomerase n=1 Tax=Halobacterium salinarum (strain ATCC 33171 / DSM 3754 / JCM 8978 / NBRC 102687 / NCIMB 764 / 91-R6) TaxID=2597657 RepID=A0A4D6GSY3_HALS9|nr:triose-phosphate isomerase [Halobacterium salinarum]QCC44869.1 triosephosphate isomerase [Halobacterium salinarum]TYO75547.1 triosephosphate isomerase [Halobacterium salinarum DSM 3754]
MFVLVNLKAYPCDPVAVAEAAADVAVDTEATVAVAPQAADLARVADTGVTTYAQHVSPNGHGSHTGSTLAESVADNGAVGTLLNHSEARRKLADIDGSLDAAARADLDTVVCANNPEQVAAAAALGPDAVAVEPPELIGTGTPVSQADPDIVEDAVAAAEAIDPSVDVYCGAGISTGEDVVAAEELGASGVLLASGVAKADDPRAALEDLVAPLD